jgi:endogenous inhibitor of DNA gyrase (YacG/DUF329 family)
MKRNCQNCGKQYEAKRSNSKYCSDNCRVSYFRKREAGEIIISVEAEPKPEKSLKGLVSKDETKNSISQQLNPLYELHADLYKEILEEMKCLRNDRKAIIERSYQTLNKDFGIDKAMLGALLGGVVGYAFTDNYKGAAAGLLLLGAAGYIWGVTDGKEKLPKILDELNKELSHIDKQISELEEQKQNHIKALQTTSKFIPLDLSSLKWKKEKLPEPELPEPKPLNFEGLAEKVSLAVPNSQRENNYKEVSVLSATDLIHKTFNVIPFQEPYKSLIGEPPFGFHGIIYGLPGQGKSTFAIQFANYLASNHGRVLYISAEEGHSKSLVDKVKQQQRLSTMLDIADVSDIETTNNIIRNTHYPFIFIDSADRLGLSAKGIQEIRAISKSSLIVIHQSTKSGEMKGEQELKHDADLVICVDRYQVSTEGEKNRYGGHYTAKINPLGV